MAMHTIQTQLDGYQIWDIISTFFWTKIKQTNTRRIQIQLYRRLVKLKSSIQFSSVQIESNTHKYFPAMQHKWLNRYVKILLWCMIKEIVKQLKVQGSTFWYQWFCLLISNQDTLICRYKESPTSRDDRNPGHYRCWKATSALETWLLEPAHTNESVRDREQLLETPGACITAIIKYYPNEDSHYLENREDPESIKLIRANR